MMRAANREWQALERDIRAAARTWMVRVSRGTYAVVNIRDFPSQEAAQAFADRNYDSSDGKVEVLEEGAKPLPYVPGELP